MTHAMTQKGSSGLWRSALPGLLVLCGVAVPPVTLAQQAPDRTQEFEFGQDYFAAGEQVDVSRAAQGDVIVAGNRVAVNSEVAGNVLAAGREVVLDAAIGSNVRAAGATVRLAPQGRIGRNATLAGSELDLQGNVAGYLLAVGKRIYINGTVGGDAQLAGEEIELGPDARITGNLRYYSSTELKRAATAEVGGTVEHEPWPVAEKKRTRFPTAGLWIWTVGLGVLAAILLGAAPAFAQGMSAAIRTRFGWSLLTGFIVLVCLPVAAIIALVTVIGIPAGLLALLSWPVLLLLGYVCAGVALGDMALARLQPDRAQVLGGRIIAAALALLALSLISRIPVAGGLISLVAMLAGSGAMLLQLWQGRKA